MQRVLPLLAVILAAALVTGCGGSSSSGSGSGSGSSSGGGGAEAALQKQFVDTVDRVGPSVVQIRQSRGLGSGVVFDSNGDIVTNAHVVGSAKTVVVTFADGSREPGKVTGSFPPDDLAVIHVDGKHGKPAQFADSSKLEVGDIVLALGNPLGLQSSVTNGIVSALGRTVGEPNGATIPNLIQTSAAINPGNSGGALVDLDGRVVGIPTLAAVDPELGGSAAPGIGFAIPSNLVKDIAGQIVKNGRVTESHRAFLGVQVGTTMGGPGALVAAVVRGGPADKAGIAPGDFIVSIAGKQTQTAAEVASVLAGLKPGQQVKVGVVTRGGARKTVQVTLAQLPTHG